MFGKRLLFQSILCLLVVTGAELTSALTIRIVNPRLDEQIRPLSVVFAEQSRRIRQLLATDVPQLHEIHPLLGWRYTPNYDKGPHRLNAAALRAVREYSERAPDGVLRIAAFGDSFVYGTEVANDDAWPSLMEGESDLEVLNYGVPGYGTDQAYLRYELEGAEYAPHVVLLGFPPTDLSRVVNVYRRFLNNSEIPLFKPRFLLDATGELHLVSAPVQDRRGYEALLRRPEEVVRFGRHDQWFAPIVYENSLYDVSAFARLASATLLRVGRRTNREKLMQGDVFNRESTAFRIQASLFEKFAAAVRGRGARPLILMLPDKSVICAIRRGDPAIYGPLIQYLKARGIDYLDAVDAFQSVDRTVDTDQWFAPGGHYSAQGNRIVATWLTGAIRDRISRSSHRRLSFRRT